MPTLALGRMVTPIFALSLLISSLLNTSVCSPLASAQQTGSTSQTDTGGNSSGAGGAPTFTLPNFIGDARAGDLYEYMHPTQKPSWDTYRKYLEGINAPTVSLQPLRKSPDPSTATNTGTIGTTMQAAAGSAVSSLTGNNGGGNSGATGGNGSTENGTAPTQSSQPLVETTTPPEATASNFDLPGAGASTNVSGMVVGPGSDLVPGLLP